MSVAPGRVHYFAGSGYGVEPCPGCGGALTPGQQRVTQEGVWRVWHRSCWDQTDTPCPFCDAQHALPYDGGCLL